MTTPDTFDRQIAHWLEDAGPEHAPARLVDAAVGEALGSRRSRGWVPVHFPAVRDGVASRSVVRLRPSLVIGLLLLGLLGSLLAAGAVQRLLTGGVRDGAIAFDSGGDVWVVDARGTAARRLTDTDDVDETAPVWSPRGDRVAIWVTSGSAGAIHLLDRDGRLVSRLVAPDGLTLPLHSAIFGWSPDGRSIAAPARGSIDEGGVTTVGVETVVLYDAESGRGELLDLGMPAWSFGWSPDGQWLGIAGPTDLFVLSTADRSLSRVAGVSITGDDAGSDPLRSWWKQLVPPTFTADSRSILFSGTRMDGRATGVDGASASQPRSGPLFLGDRPRDGDIRVAAIADATDVELLGGPTNDLGARVSPDGRTVAFARSTSKTTGGAFERASDLYVRSWSSDTEHLVASDLSPVMAWAPSGRSLLARAADGQALIVVDVAGEADPLRIPVPDGVGAYSWQAVEP